MECPQKKNLKQIFQENSVRNRVMQQIQHMADHAVIKNRRFLDDEQLIRSEQMSVLEEIFNDKENPDQYQQPLRRLCLPHRLETPGYAI